MLKTYGDIAEPTSQPTDTKCASQLWPWAPERPPGIGPLWLAACYVVCLGCRLRHYHAPGAFHASGVPAPGGGAGRQLWHHLGAAAAPGG